MHIFGKQINYEINWTFPSWVTMKFHYYYHSTFHSFHKHLLMLYYVLNRSYRKIHHCSLEFVLEDTSRWGLVANLTFSLKKLVKYLSLQKAALVPEKPDDLMLWASFGLLLTLTVIPTEQCSYRSGFPSTNSPSLPSLLSGLYPGLGYLIFGADLTYLNHSLGNLK